MNRGYSESHLEQRAMSFLPQFVQASLRVTVALQCGHCTCGIDGIPPGIIVGEDTGVGGAGAAVDPVFIGAEQWGQCVAPAGTCVPQKGHLFLDLAVSI